MGALSGEETNIQKVSSGRDIQKCYIVSRDSKLRTTRHDMDRIPGSSRQLLRDTSDISIDVFSLQIIKLF